MTVPVTIEHETNQPAPQLDQKPTRKPRVPAKIVKLIDLLDSGACRSRKAACERLGIDQSYASRELRKVHVIEYMERKTRVSIALLQVPAAATLERLMAEGQSEHVQKDVAIHALALNGHKSKNETQVSVNVEVRAGYVIDLSGGAKPVIDVTPTHD